MNTLKWVHWNDNWNFLRDVIELGWRFLKWANGIATTYQMYYEILVDEIASCRGTDDENDQIEWQWSLASTLTEYDQWVEDKKMLDD